MASNSIRTARLAKQISLRGLAKTLAISPAYLSDIELGKRTPNTQVMADIAKLLDVPYHKHVYACTECGLPL